MEKNTDRIFVVQWNFEKINFFKLQIKRVGLMTLILGSFKFCKLICVWFIANDLNLWATLFCVLRGFFSDFWGPQNVQLKAKSAQILDSWPFTMPIDRTEASVGF